MTLPNMNADQRASAELAQGLLKAIKTSAIAARQSANDGINAMNVAMIREQDPPLSNYPAATRAYAGVGKFTALHSRAQQLVADTIRAHAEMSEALAMTFADANLVINGTVNSPGGGRR